MAQFLKEDIRDRILQSAKKVFAKKGLQGSSMKEIAEKAGISVGNIYRYYRGKEELHQAVVDSFLVSVNRIVRQASQVDFEQMDSQAEFEEYFYKPITQFINLYLQEKELFWRVFIINEKEKYYNRSVKSFITSFSEMIYDAYTANSRVQISRTEALFLANSLIFGIIGPLELEKAQGVEEITNYIFKLFKGHYYLYDQDHNR